MSSSRRASSGSHAGWPSPVALTRRSGTVSGTSAAWSVPNSWSQAACPNSLRVVGKMAVSFQSSLLMENGRQFPVKRACRPSPAVSLLFLGATGTRGSTSATGTSAAATWFLLRLCCRFLLFLFLFFCCLVLLWCFFFGAPGAGFTASAAACSFLLGATGTLLAASATGSLGNGGS